MLSGISEMAPSADNWHASGITYKCSLDYLQE